MTSAHVIRSAMYRSVVIGNRADEERIKGRETLVTGCRLAEEVGGWIMVSVNTRLADRWNRCMII